jgi:uroporphyrinogen decarboxylase
MTERTANCLAKLDRMNKALRHEEPDRVPVSDFFWGAFLERWRDEKDLPPDTDIYMYYDLDWIVTVPNMDPHIKDFEVLSETNEEVIVRTGFEAVIRKKFADPMPEFVSFGTDTIEKAEAFEFDDPWDDRRYFSGGDNQIGGVGDGYARDLPPWIDTVKSLRPNFPVYGSQCEANEYMTRMVGPKNLLLWAGLYPERFGHFVQRTNEWAIELLKSQIKAADGLIDGIVIWGDVAYRKDLFFHPDYWRKWYKPGLKTMIAICHEHDLPVIYHGCGNVSRIFEDFIEIGLDAYNPLEAKAGMDVVDLRRKYGHRIAFCGNMNVIDWAHASREELKAIVLRKLNAAKGGGMIFQSDHSVPTNVSAENYEYVVNLVREYGQYPLELGEYDIPELS